MVLFVVPVYSASLMSFISRLPFRRVSFTDLSNESFSTLICLITLPLKGSNTASFLMAPLFSAIISSCPRIETTRPNLPNRPFLCARKKTVSSCNLFCDRQGISQVQEKAIMSKRYKVVRTNIPERGPGFQLVIISGKLRNRR